MSERKMLVFSSNKNIGHYVETSISEFTLVSDFRNNVMKVYFNKSKITTILLKNSQIFLKSLKGNKFNKLIFHRKKKEF